LRVLYITYYGLLKHLCQTQVIPYLEGLAANGADVSILSFEERTASRDDELTRSTAIRRRLSESRIRWYPLRYHKRPSLPATAYDVIVGTSYALYLSRKLNVDVIHSRNHIPALMALIVKRLLGTNLIFDLRGVMAEEYADAGTWRQNSIPYRLVKWVESRAFRDADGIVMLTNKIRDALKNSPGLAQSSAPIEIIPCCVDTRKYTASQAHSSSVRRQLQLEGKLVLAYAGSLGGWYMADSMAAFFSELSRMSDQAHFLILTQSPHELITAHLQRENVKTGRYTVLTVPSDEVPRYLAAADFAVSFIKPCFSKLSSSPTKIGEYLASGLPFITNRGIGDIDELVTTKQIGVFTEAFNRDAYRDAIGKMFSMLQESPVIRARCKQIAREEFSLDLVGCPRYRKLYSQLFPAREHLSRAETSAFEGAIR